MKTKSLFIALAAALCILSGCSKDSKDKNTDSSLLTEFKRAESFIDQDTATVFNQMADMGYVKNAQDSNSVSFIKGSIDNILNTYTFISSANGKISLAGFRYNNSNLDDTNLSVSTFVDFVRYLGKSYKSSFNETYIFQCCYYGDDNLNNVIDSYETLDSSLVNLVQENNIVIGSWQNNNGKLLTATRYLSTNNTFVEFLILK